MDKVKEIGGKVKDFFVKMSLKVRILLAVCLAVMIGVVIAIIVYANTRPYAMLFSDLSTEDMSTIVTYLEENNVTDYQIRNNDTILVPESQEATLRAQLLMNGSYPKTGFSYDTYLDNVGALSSESDRERLSLFETQDRLGATIGLLTGIDTAVVNISPQEDNRWILDTENLTKAEASVVVTMREGYEMTREMASTIRSLLMNAVKGLDMENVTVADQDGRTWSGDTISDANDASELMLRIQAQVDELTRNKILDLLVPMYGAENISVAVHSTVDVSKTYEESITYDYPEETAWNSLGGHGLIGEYAWDNSLLRGDDETVGGVVGTTTNADLNEYVVEQGILDANANEIGASGQIEYDNDQTTLQRENYGGVITDVMVSVAINSTAIQDSSLTNVEGLVHPVAKAAGISTEVEADKIAIVLRPFYVEPEVAPVIEPEPLLPGWAIIALIVGIVLFLTLLILILVLRSRAKKRKAAQLAAEAEAAAALIPAVAEGPEGEEGEPQGAQIMDINTERSMALRQDVRKFVEENPEIAAQMVKSWLRGSGEDQKNA